MVLQRVDREVTGLRQFTWGMAAVTAEQLVHSIVPMTNQYN